MSRAVVIVKTLDNEFQEIERVVKECNTLKAAEKYVEDHEQDFSDDPSIYAVYVEEIK